MAHEHLRDRIDAWALTAAEITDQIQKGTFKGNRYELRELQAALIRLARDSAEAAEYLHTAIMKAEIADDCKQWLRIDDKPQGA